MRSSSTISLFSERPELNQRPYSFMVSVLVHGAALGLLFFGIISAPKVKPPAVVERYAVRHLDLRTLDTEMERVAASGVKSLRPHSTARQLPPGGSPAARQPVLRQVAQSAPARQTLVQPDILKPLALPVEIPVPTVVIWNATKTPAKTLVAPLPEKPPVADVKPSL